MSQQPHRSQQVDYLHPSRMSLRRVFKLFLYFVGAIFSGFGLLGGALLATGSNKELTNEAGWVAVVFWLLILVGSIFIFFRWHFHLYTLRWLHYLVLLLLITVGGIIALVLGNAFSPNPNNTASSLIVSYIVILYGVALIAIAFLKPPLRQQIDESVRRILKTLPSKQISLAELIGLLQREYHCSEDSLAYHIGNLDYVEQVEVPGTNIKMCRVRGSNNALVFPQIQAIQNATLRRNIERALPDLTEEKVDIGLFSLGKEFETTLKAYLVAAYAKGNLTSTPGGKSPDQLSLEQMIKCVKSNGIVTDDAVLSYLRQTRNDQAHGTVPTLASLSSEVCKLI